MAKDVPKIRARGEDDDLIQAYRTEVACGECKPISWSTPVKGTQIDPPTQTDAIVVDLVESQGAIRIFETASGEYLAGAGTEEAGNFVIIPWSSNWWFRVSGSLRVGYIEQVKQT